MATISSDVLASYAADAAREVEGIRGLVESTLHRHKGVRVLEDDGQVRIELHISVDWGVSVPDVGSAVQTRVHHYLEGMAGSVPAAVNVVVDAVGPAP